MRPVLSMPMLIACRALMGVGAGAMTPAALGMMGDLFNERDFPKGFGLMGVIQFLSNLRGTRLPLYRSGVDTAISRGLRRDMRYRRAVPCRHCGAGIWYSSGSWNKEFHFWQIEINHLMERRFLFAI
jgi:hypothetical protein